MRRVRELDNASSRKNGHPAVPQMVGNYEKSVFPIFMETLTRRNYWHIRYTRVNLFNDSALAGLCYNSKGRCFVELHYLIARGCSLRAFSHTCVHDAGLGSQVFPVKPDFTRSETTQGNVESTLSLSVIYLSHVAEETSSILPNGMGFYSSARSGIGLSKK